MVSRARKRKLEREAGTPAPEPAERMRGLAGTSWEGTTCLEAARMQAEAMGGPPERGRLYRVGLWQASEDGQGRSVVLIGEYMGAVIDGKSGGEFAYTFAVRNPPGVRADGPDGAMVLLPLDVEHLSPARPGDMDEDIETRTMSPDEEWRTLMAPQAPPSGDN